MFLDINSYIVVDIFDFKIVMTLRRDAVKILIENWDLIKGDLA